MGSVRDSPEPQQSFHSGQDVVEDPDRSRKSALVAFDRVEDAVGNVVDQADVALPTGGLVPPPENEIARQQGMFGRRLDQPPSSPEGVAESACAECETKGRRLGVLGKAPADESCAPIGRRGCPPGEVFLHRGARVVGADLTGAALDLEKSNFEGGSAPCGGARRWIRRLVQRLIRGRVVRVGQSPMGQRTDDTVDGQRPTSRVEVSCLKVLDRLAEGSVEFESHVGADQKTSLDQQLGQVGDFRADVTE